MTKKKHDQTWNRLHTRIPLSPMNMELVKELRGSMKNDEFFYEALTEFKKKKNGGFKL
jgi:hypothetical protein